MVALIEFGIFLILEFTSIRRNQKLNDDEHDKLNTNCSRDICGSREDSREGNETE